MDDNPEIRDRLDVNKSTYHNKRPRERLICFIRGAKWMKINQLNGPSPIHYTSTRLSQSIQSIRHVCCWLGMQKKSPLKVLQNSFRPLEFPVSKCFPVSLTHAQTLPLAVRKHQFCKQPFEIIQGQIAFKNTVQCVNKQTVVLLLHPSAEYKKLAHS